MKNIREENIYCHKFSCPCWLFSIFCSWEECIFTFNKNIIIVHFSYKPVTQMSFDGKGHYQVLILARNSDVRCSIVLFSDTSSCELITSQTLKLKLTVRKFSLEILYQSIISNTKTKISLFFQLAYTCCGVYFRKCDKLGVNQCSNWNKQRNTGDGATAKSSDKLRCKTWVMKSKKHS